MKKTNSMSTVLVLDDDPEQLASTQLVLAPLYKVVTASTDTEALRLASATRPNLILLDVMLQNGQNGFSVFHELSNDPVTADIPVIFLTGVNEVTGLSFGSKEVGQYLGKPPAAFLEKPLPPAVLLREVAKALAPQ
jgi:putative two-component system response regulator